jgi:hypothetical protein
MTFSRLRPILPCPLCSSDANGRDVSQFRVVECSLCGDFRLSNDAEDEVSLPLEDPEKLALVRHLLRKLQKQQQRPTLDENFFKVARKQRLPSPAEACDNLISYLAERSGRRPGAIIYCHLFDVVVCAEIGVVDQGDLIWIIRTLKEKQLVNEPEGTYNSFNLTIEGWQRFEELQRAHISSNYAFFARKFENDVLDEVVEQCLRPAVEQTGFELRSVTQRAGLIDAIIEDEIRRCKFLLADLSDHNAGAYWEAGFAEGLGKPVIYICREKKDDGSSINTHFDTDHRHTIRWNPSSLEAASKQLKAVIRNTLLGDAKQDD